MNKRQRLDSVIAGQRPDRLPVLGGWIAHPRALVELAGASVEEYNRAPREVAVRAYKALDVDGLVDLFVTKDVDAYRCIDEHTYAKAGSSRDFDETVAAVEGLPDADEYAGRLNFDADYANYRQWLLETQALCGDIPYMPANWGAGAKLSWFFDYGYENFFLLIGLRPDLGAKLCRLGGEMGHHNSRLVASAVKEGLFPRALLLGEDVCTQRGPMISMEFVEEHYAPALTYGLEPLLEVGCRPVWHADGDVRPMLPMLLRCGIEGFQGFQPECGMHLEEIVKLRTRDGGKLLIFGPLAVTTELPVLSPAEIRAKVRHYAEVCRDNADLLLFTSNTITPDVPVETIQAMHDEARRIV
ncbi:MAG: hypothetical protein FWE88_08290 [Phycisphaerae bacterium]|nr:hypothetical protein [Phycisphaerae bacterium]